MAGWDNGTHGWGTLGWARTRRDATNVSCSGARWTAPEVAATAALFFVHWEFGLSFLALKLWQQASGYRGSAFAFARDKWEALVASSRRIFAGAPLPFTVHVGPRSSGSYAFDTWRETELSRIEAERERLRVAEQEFAAYRDELLRAQDREDFERFMRGRDARR